jgi:mono/diheme cytochrome c family protein
LSSPPCPPPTGGGGYGWGAIVGMFVLAALSLGQEQKPRAIEGAKPPATPVDFNRQILPILSENCFACHGPDAKQRKAKLRLDVKDGAFAELRSGGHAIVPGKSGESKLIERVSSDDPEHRMPPPKTGKRLKPDQIALIQQWIDQGARWTQHWAWVAPRRPAIPKVHDASWATTRNCSAA